MHPQRAQLRGGGFGVHGERIIECVIAAAVLYIECGTGLLQRS